MAHEHANVRLDRTGRSSLFASVLASVIALAMATGAPAADAHSLDELEAELADRERYFQAVDEVAPAFTLADADGATVRLADLRGKVVVLHFIYASCRDVCPLHAELIARVQDMVNQAPMADSVRFLSITTDPRNDTPDVLRGYGPAHRLDAANWAFLTIPAGASEDATRRLAQAFGHRFEHTGDGAQVHGVVTHVIDREGRWRANFHGLRFDPLNLVWFVNALVDDVHGNGRPEPDGFWDRLRRLF